MIKEEVEAETGDDDELLVSSFFSFPFTLFDLEYFGCKFAAISRLTLCKFF